MQAALNVLDGEPFDDIDGMTITVPPAIEMTYHDGHVVHSPSERVWFVGRSGVSHSGSGRWMWLGR